MAVLAIDFDHTLVDGDKPLEGAREAINILREEGHKIVIHSCNNTEWIKKVLNDNDIRFDYIWGSSSRREPKPICDIYIDDKGFRFSGSWKEDLPQILDLLKGFDNRKW